ncbi:hypothetical protein SAMN04488518_1075 [Pseudovibrio ascidiaceicola]|uniref:Uncharacterized protein n=1 Tax=Pseudovibrio ascidiaceicola TaxID=285279 RepID=A0A1I4AXX6_9HYPH|nr:hypothetical protein SAMN04488518_1075 [Pseudovibrio ascidiaceicola]
MPCFCFCPDIIPDINLNLLVPLVLKAGEATALPRIKGPSLRVTSPHLFMRFRPFNFLSLAQLLALNASINHRLTAAADLALRVTESATLPAAKLKLKKLAQTSAKFALPLALKLGALPGHILAKLGLAAQLILQIKGLGLNPFNLNLGKLNLILPKAKINLPLLGLVDLGLKQNLNMNAQADLKALAKMLADFGNWNLGFKFDLKAAFKILAALNIIGLLQLAFGESLFSGNVKAWARITAKLSLFSRLLPQLNLKLPTAKVDLSDLDLNIGQADWLRNANRISMRASARASLRASARLNAGLFARTEAAIGLAYALSAALNIKPTSKCCSRCALIF